MAKKSKKSRKVCVKRNKNGRFSKSGSRKTCHKKSRRSRKSRR